MKTAIDFNSNTDLRKFLNSLTEADYKGSKTKKSIKDKAVKFSESGAYGDYEKLNGVEIHNALLCLIYDSI